MNDCVFALPGFLILYIACVGMGVNPIIGAVVLAVTFVSLGLAD